MHRPVCLITGATEGVGRATGGRAHSRRGLTVVMAARNAAKAEKVKWEIAKSTGNADTDYIVTDLASLEQVCQLAETFKTRFPKLDVLINNAGVFLPAQSVTCDGYETTFQVNYLSHFYLTQLLLDEVKKSDQGRIINLTSNIYGMGRYDQNVARAETGFSTMGSYATSKLLLLLFTIELASQLRGTRITANAVHPGVVKTHMLMSATGFFKLISYLARPFAISPQKGAATSVYLASSPDVLTVTGQYFTNCRSVPIKSKFNTERNRQLLWRSSMDCLQ